MTTSRRFGYAASLLASLAVTSVIACGGKVIEPPGGGGGGSGGSGASGGSGGSGASGGSGGSGGSGASGGSGGSGATGGSGGSGGSGGTGMSEGGAGDSGECVDVAFSPADSTCNSDSDCNIAYAGELCISDGSFCACEQGTATAVNQAGFNAYESAVTSLPQGDAGIVCSCPASSIICHEHQCLLCPFEGGGMTTPPGCPTILPP